jgi:hypothetical protein
MSDANRLLRISGGALAFSLISACAGSPPRPSSPQQALSGNQPNGAATSAASQPSAADPAQIDVAMRKRGYQPATFRGERVYCRNEAVTGSNLQSKVCRTAKQIDDQERAGKDVLNGKRPAGCLPTTGCN